MLVSHPDWVGKRVTVDLFEPLYDDEHSSVAPRGGYDVEVDGVGATRLGLIPASRGAMPDEVHPPVRVTGVLRTAKFGFVLAAERIEPLSFPTPERLAHADELYEHGSARRAERYVEVEDEYATAFEVSRLGRRVWLDAYPDAKIRCEPPDEKVHRLDVERHRVRVVGYAHAGDTYGHLGGYPAEIVATEIVYLDPARPECR